MTVTNWTWLDFYEKSDDGALTKPHLVPARLKAHLLADLQERGSNITHRAKVFRKAMMDGPGMMAVNRPYEIFRLSGLTLSIPSEDCIEFAERCRTLALREFAPLPQGKTTRPYYKLHSWNRCIVFTPLQKVALELQLMACLVGAEARARVFYAIQKNPAEVLREAAAIVENRPLAEIPDLGGHEHDRFYRKEREQA